jgi:hypothetical protein
VLRGLGLLALLAVVAVPAASARPADGDPASDALIVRNVFLPFSTPSTDAAAALTREVGAAYAHGFRLKVAVIASDADLGTVPSLFGRPGDYAKFLGQELEQYFVGPLLIVMPAGYGIYDGGRSTRAERRILAGTHPSGSSPDDLTTSGAKVVHRLVAAGALESKDIRPPFASAFSATVTPGTRARLGYAVFDDSGKTSERLAVRDSRNHVLAKWSLRLHATIPTRTYFVSWNVPPQVTTTGLRFCLAAYDPSGNHAPAASCAPVVVKP